MNYHFNGEENLDSPSLVYYQDVIEENINKATGIAGGAQRLWPHIKTHKSAPLLRMQIERGIKRFKCATIAEAELAAMAGAEHVLIAYPLVGPAIGRFAKLIEKYTLTVDWQEIRDMQLLNLRHGNNNIGISDIVIAQNCMQNELKIITHDRHFELMAGYMPLGVFAGKGA